MGKYFSIGEMSKLHNISVQTLRHYEKIDLLKPSYTNEKTGYRYYSMKQFSTVDLIKQCKAMGLSLDEIKEVIGNYTSLESILNIIGNQKQIIDEKIIELNNIKENINFLENKIKSTLNNGINKVFIQHNDERKFIKYDYKERYTEEFELNLRKVLLDIEENYGNLSSELAFSTSYKDIIEKNKVTYNNVLIHLNEKVNSKDKNIITLPKGDYITMYFDDTYNNSSNYYEDVINYIKQNNLNVSGDFYEIYIMTRVGNDERVKSLAQIEILKI